MPVVSDVFWVKRRKDSPFDSNEKVTVILVVGSWFTTGNIPVIR